ncbi:MAG TPA: PHP domain-containing protein [Clostridiaceae bacterium]|nr:PHP domain-containing protein [Clostridiaceae bacterium]
MKVYADLHIHTALSPCADEDMTPGNIVAMASLAGLDAIAITDHNIALNVRPAIKYGEQFDVLVIPGMELETREEVHVVCLFETLEQALDFQGVVHKSMTGLKNNPDIFGRQLMFDEEDEIIGEYDDMLLCATDIGIDDVFSMIEGFGGIAYPAHVDRDSYSVFSQLAFIPFDYPYKFVEISIDCKSDIIEKYPQLKKYNLLKASDSHDLTQIDKHDMYLECERLDAKSVIEALKNNRIIYERTEPC